MSFGPPMILAPVDEHDDEQVAADVTEAVTVAAATGKRVWISDGSAYIEPAPEPRRWWHWITRGMA